MAFWPSACVKARFRFRQGIGFGNNKTCIGMVLKHYGSNVIYCGDLCIKKWFKPPWHVIWQNWTRFNWLNGVISLALSLYLRTQGLRQPTANARIFREIKSPGQKNSRQNIAERKILGSENSRNSFFPKNLKKKIEQIPGFFSCQGRLWGKTKTKPFISWAFI